MNQQRLGKYGTSLVVLLCAAFISFSMPAAAQNRSTISGYVFGPGRIPVAQVPIELRNDYNSVIARTRTTGSGQFAFYRVPSGRLTVTVLPLGTNLEEQSQNIEIAGLGARGQQLAENVQLDFYLKPRKATNGGSENEVVFAQEVAEAARKAYESAISDLESKRTREGIAGLKRSIEIFPNYFLALQRLGAEQLLQEQYEDAIKTLRTAVSVNRRCFTCWHGITYGSFALQKWNDAVESAEKAIELEKNSVGTLTMLGIAQRALKRYPESEKFLLRAKKLDEGKTPDIYWNLALLYAYNLKRYQDAADALELYLKANPSIPDPSSVRKVIKRLRENRPPTD
jgi:tetratricopeptide (TPR) repeat protein